MAKWEGDKFSKGKNFQKTFTKGGKIFREVKNFIMGILVKFLGLLPIFDAKGGKSPQNSKWGETNIPQDRPLTGGTNFFEILEGGKSVPPPVLKSCPCMSHIIYTIVSCDSPKAAMKKWQGRIDNVLPINNVYMSLALPVIQLGN